MALWVDEAVVTIVELVLRDADRAVVRPPAVETSWRVRDLVTQRGGPELCQPVGLGAVDGQLKLRRRLGFIPPSSAQ